MNTMHYKFICLNINVKLYWNLEVTSRCVLSRFQKLFAPFKVKTAYLRSCQSKPLLSTLWYLWPSTGFSVMWPNWLTSIGWTDKLLFDRNPSVGIFSFDFEVNSVCRRYFNLFVQNSLLHHNKNRPLF